MKKITFKTATLKDSNGKVYQGEYFYDEDNKSNIRVTLTETNGATKTVKLTAVTRRYTELTDETTAASSNIIEFKSGWVDYTITLDTTGLTANEIEVMKGIRTNNFSDIYESNGDWSFGVCDECSFSEKVYRGVAASLVKKGLIQISDTEGKGKFRDMSLELTEEGRKRYGKKEG